jgi:TolB-like protein
LIIAVGTGAILFGILRNNAAPSATQQQTSPNPKSIAVLPFEDFSPDGDQGWLASGLTEELLNSLSKTPDLLVKARNAATVASGTEDMPSVGRSLNVAFLLKGSVRRGEGRIRVSAQLVRASDGSQLWSENFDRPSADLILVQEEIAVAIARALKTVMSQDKLEDMLRLGTRSVSAYEEYLRGLAIERQMMEGGDAGLAPKAYSAFERARSLDPNFADAHWYAAGFLNRGPVSLGPTFALPSGTPNERLPEAIARIDAAIAASDGRPENLKYRAERERLGLQFPQALADIQRYLKQRPRDQGGWELLVRLAGYTSDFRLMAAATLELDALDQQQEGNLGPLAIGYMIFALQPDEAVAIGTRQLKARPTVDFAKYQLHRAYLWTGRGNQAKAVLGQIRASSLPREYILLADLRQACADKTGDAGPIYQSILQLPQPALVARWEGALLSGDTQGAIRILAPYDRPGMVNVLVDFLQYPWFESRDFPYLQAQLGLTGVMRKPAIRLPYACPAATPGKPQRSLPIGNI